MSPGGVQGEGRSATPYPLFMTRAQGSRIWDVDGNEYVDLHSSFGAVLLGHNDPWTNATVRRAMDEHGVSFSTANPLEVELAERLVGMIPSAERVVFPWPRLDQTPRRRTYSRLARWTATTDSGVSFGPRNWSCSTTSQPL